MSDLTKSSDARLAKGLHANVLSAIAGQEIGAGDACYLNSSGYLVKASTAATYTGLTGSIAFHGLAAKAIPSGTVGEIYGRGAEFFYADSGLTVPAKYWGSATAGKIGDAKAGSAADEPIAESVSATNIVLVRGV